ncbi:hypothetical protein EJ04DRAFT_511093 [Polyplosphaeria fusca]|uniref:Uncharacterized protein n=1 Tax=Polyplosphaeria fusca TaxID=682080 RepID=A0A9P4R3P1_9PLEO|nr:hypothetical protein EJ04DRAFT_511093 [Polyplosphaeria fusca]
MASCCRTCDHRNHAAHATRSQPPTLLDICLISITFKTPLFLTFANSPHTALNTLLNNITDAAETTSRPTQFTTWSPCGQNSKTVIILTTASETVASATSPVFEPVLKYLDGPPSIQHVFLDYSITNLAHMAPGSRIAADLMLIRAPNSGIAGVIGKRFGWDPKRSSLMAQLEIQASAGFNRPGDLIRDFWAWAELNPGEPVSPSSSLGGEYEREFVLKSTNSDEKNMALDFPEDKDDEEETLVMLFQWASHADADRFKHPLQKSYGLNGQTVDSDLWDRDVAHPVRQLQGIGAKVESYRLELRGVEERIEGTKKEARERSGSRRLSGLATGLGERVSGFWR